MEAIPDLVVEVDREVPDQDIQELQEVPDRDSVIPIAMFL